MDGCRGAARLRGSRHEFIEVFVTLCVPAPRANKMTVEIDVITDDAVDGAIGRAVEHRIETVSSHRSAKARSARRAHITCAVPYAAGNRFTRCCYNRLISSVFGGSLRAGGWENLPVLSALQFCATSS
jgi:hypothetical protein